MIFPILTDRDEWNFLVSLKDSDAIGYPRPADQGYYARVLQYKYSQCQKVKLTAMTLQVFQPGMSTAPVRMICEQIARQGLLDSLDGASLSEVITKIFWLQILKDEKLFPNF